jgi:hypothetical protein
MTRFIKWGIWTYLILLIFEGAFRKWIFPGAADLFLIVRDPVVLAIYALALGSGIVPRNGFMVALGGLVAASFILPFLAGQTNVLVTLYGMRTNYLHVPLIWIMAEVLDRRDVERLGMAVLVLAIPTTLLMVKQFNSPMDAFVNRGVGGDETGQIYGALGRIRPPGFFSFISGVMVYFPLAAAFFLNFVTTIKKRWLWWLVLVSGFCIVLALPVSISRGAMINTVAVGVVFVLAMLKVGLINAGTVRVGVAALVLLVALSFLPFFKEAQEVFMDRWNTAKAESQGDAWGSLTTRVTAGFVTPFEVMMNAPFFGHGIGVGSNVGAKLLSGKVGFLLSENEWERAMLELGPLLGLAFIGFRVVLSLYLLQVCWRALKENRDTLPLVIWSAAAPAVLLHQWAPPTLLGFAVFGSGLILAAVNYPEEEEEEDDEDEDDEHAHDGHDSPRGHDDDEDRDEEPDDSSTDGELSEVEKRRRRLRGLS